jgi:putative transposase
VLTEYVRHYNEERPHRGLQLDQPIPRAPIPMTDHNITRRDVLGGMIHEYQHAA